MTMRLGRSQTTVLLVVIGLSLSCFWLIFKVTELEQRLEKSIVSHDSEILDTPVEPELLKQAAEELKTAVEAFSQLNLNRTSPTPSNDISNLEVEVEQMSSGSREGRQQQSSEVEQLEKPVEEQNAAPTNQSAARDSIPPSGECPPCRVLGPFVVCGHHQTPQQSKSLWTSPKWCDNINTEPIQLEGNTVVVKLLWPKKFGNGLSLYWQALAVAVLGGLQFRVENVAQLKEQDTWTRHLPVFLDVINADTRRQLGLPMPTQDLFEAACVGCKVTNETFLFNKPWLFPHRCEDSWMQIRPLIQVITHQALKDWFESEGHHLERPAPSELVVYEVCSQTSPCTPTIYPLTLSPQPISATSLHSYSTNTQGLSHLSQRCSPETFASHPEYHPVTHSFWDRVREEAGAMGDVATVSFVGLQGNQFCRKLRAASHDAVSTRLLHRDIHITDRQKAAVDDFAYIAYARRVIVPWLGSSFGLWASMASCGEVWAPGFITWQQRDRTLPGYHFVDAKYVDFKKISELLED